MSLHDYAQASALATHGAPSFDALIMTALWRADSANAARLAAAFPDTTAEFRARYHAPAGVLPDDPSPVESLAARADPEAFAGRHNPCPPPEVEERRRAVRAQALATLAHHYPDHFELPATHYTDTATRSTP